ncbi:ABC transporter permease [Candidatus Methylomirabilis limnetica]|uniref:ABC transporter permease n=1 Tax=Candidatus Methylomirabilis limnetica TaxID=2033718 RepID=A0A2T4TYZ3_9BACT|nr:ABC transporter permease subunit [Candidatus Methylomirabilis limnetica]PTL36329.1 ABC transporter permease [Candidatus Methylomirabilis limnetica]
MKDSTNVDVPGEPLQTARPFIIPREKIRRRLLLDRLARWVVTLGGAAIIVSILAILFIIAYGVYPLFRKPTAVLLGALTTSLDSAPLAVGVDEYREIVYVVTASGVHFVSVKDGSVPASNRLQGLHGATVVGTSALGRGQFALGLSDGRAIPAEVGFSVTFPEGRRRVEAELVTGDPIAVDPDRHPLARLAYASTPNGPMTAAAVGPKALILVTVKETTALIGPSTKEESRERLTLPVEGEITQILLDGRGENLFAGTSSGQVIRVDLQNPNDPKVAGVVPATIRPGIGVSTMGFLIGDRTLVVGDTMGGVSSWQLVRADGEEQRLAKVHDFLAHTGPVVAFAPSRRDKGFVTADASGIIHIHYGTTGKTLLTLKAADMGLSAVTFAPKVDGVLTVDAKGGFSHWSVENPHPEISWGSLFGKIWYEGYSAPAYVWQSTGGTDDFEAKFSLAPLIFGTIKGTFYALLFAIPLALLGALYTSQFMHPTLRGIVKPTVEIMAALPSVVLGFLAGLWLAPLVEQVVPGLFLMPIVTTLLILIVVFCWQFVPTSVRSRVKAGTEVALLIPIVILGGWISFQLGGTIERLLLSGDYRGWLLNVLGLTYDQRNCLVVGIAMGFAVIPIIFTIAEDSLSNVPQHLVAGSLALGATRWQTALRVVLPTASPGIFSAIMIGFGRAVGETMIVLMATGNTPVMDWSIFNGFRALSANIAVELPEAPEGGTLFRILFLAALLLFVMTFIVNTVAELVRLKLRQRYRAL